MKLFTKVVLVTVPLVIAISLALGYLSFFFTRSILEEHIKDHQRIIIKETLDKVDRLLNERFDDIQTVGSSQLIQDSLIKSQKAEDIALVQKKLDSLAVLTGPWDELKIIDLRGTVTNSNKSEEVNRNIKDDLDIEEKTVFNKALKGEVNYSDAYFDKEFSRTTIVFAAPIRNDQVEGKPIVGIIMGGLSWPIITELLESARQTGSQAILNLHNKYGLEIANSDNDPQGIFKLNNKENKAVAQALSGKQTSIVTKGSDIKGEVLISATQEKGFLNYHGNGWVLTLEEPSSIVFAPALNSALKLTFIVILTLLTGAVIAVIFLYRTLRPIDLLTQASQRVAKGDFSTLIDIKSKDEVGQLANSFNVMTDKVKEYQESLEKKVSERTQELDSTRAAQLKQLEEMERMNKMMTGRELKMIELKQKIKSLETQLGEKSGNNT